MNNFIKPRNYIQINPLYIVPYILVMFGIYASYMLIKGIIYIYIHITAK